jgi:hypothetical protein
MNLAINSVEENEKNKLLKFLVQFFYLIKFYFEKKKRKENINEMENGMNYLSRS